jgi:hypothetical protein
VIKGYDKGTMLSILAAWDLGDLTKNDWIQDDLSI